MKYYNNIINIPNICFNNCIDPFGNTKNKERKKEINNDQYFVQ